MNKKDSKNIDKIKEELRKMTFKSHPESSGFIEDALRDAYDFARARGVSKEDAYDMVANSEMTITHNRDDEMLMELKIDQFPKIEKIPKCGFQASVDVYEVSREMQGFTTENDSADRFWQFALHGKRLITANQPECRNGSYELLLNWLFRSGLSRTDFLRTHIVKIIFRGAYQHCICFPSARDLTWWSNYNEVDYAYECERGESRDFGGIR